MHAGAHSYLGHTAVQGSSCASIMLVDRVDGVVALEELEVVLELRQGSKYLEV